MGRIVIIGGGPAGYEAALVAAQLDAEVTVVEAEGAGGACVLHDCVPSKTFIASSDVMTARRDTEEFGIKGAAEVTVDAAAVHQRVRRLAAAQSSDIYAKLTKAGVEFIAGSARLGEDTLGHTHRVDVTPIDSDATYSIPASTVLIATGATPARTADRRAGCGADPRLAPGVRPAGVAGAPHRGRLRRHRRRIRLGVPGDGRRRDPRLQPGPGHAARGRGRGDGDRPGLPGSGHEDPQQLPGGRRPPHRRRGGRRPRRRPYGRGLACPHGRRLGAADRHAGPRRVRRGRLRQRLS